LVTIGLEIMGCAFQYESTPIRTAQEKAACGVDDRLILGGDALLRPCEFRQGRVVQIEV